MVHSFFGGGPGLAWGSHLPWPVGVVRALLFDELKSHLRVILFEAFKHLIEIICLNNITFTQSQCVSLLHLCVSSIRVVVTIEQTEEDIQKAVACIREAASALLIN